MGDNERRLAFKPPHPGEYLREDILPSLNMTVKDFAIHIGVTRNTMSKLLNEHSDVSTVMAIRLGQAFKNGARFWLSLQMQHDIWKNEHSHEISVVPFDWEGHSAA